MQTLFEMERYLAERTANENDGYRLDMTHAQKREWIMANASRTRAELFKMRNVGRRAWGNFLWSFGLEETVKLSKIETN